jgi:hypothetical protein
VDEPTYTCPRCLYEAPLRPGVRFCPHCGLDGAKDAALDTAPLEVRGGGRTFRVLDRIGVGSVCTVYRCRFADGGRDVEGVFKIARDARANPLVTNEAEVLAALTRWAGADQFAPFLPRVEASFQMGDRPAAAARLVNVLRMHDAIRSADEMYTLNEVRAHYPAGLDGRDVAWVWRRLLRVLGFVHRCAVTHAAVLPEHVLLEPREHKLVLIDWCAAVRRGIDVRWDGAPTDRPPKLVPAQYLPWYRRQGALRFPPTPALDVAMGARCMIQLLGGDPVTAELPPTVDPALRRYFGRCLDPAAADESSLAWKLLEDFDKLIEALWGSRKFRPLSLPPKRAARV